MKWIKILIIIIIIIIIILAVTLLSLLKNDNVVSDIVEGKNAGEETAPIENANIEKVTNRDNYYTVKYILDTYFEYVNNIDATAEELELINIPNEKEIIQNYTKTAIESLRNVLDEEYLENKTDDQIKKASLNYKNKGFRIDKLYYQDKTLRKRVYFAYISLDYNKEIKTIIKIDAITNCFTILPEDYITKNNYLEKNLSQIQVEDINENTYNKYEDISITDKMMAGCYLEDYGKLVLNNIEESYKMLDEEYREKKYSTLEEYKKHIEDSKKDYKWLKLKEYYITNEDDVTIYTCKDQYENIYMFKEKSVMEYNVQLDDYTLENKEFNKIYENAQLRDKGLLNVDKFFKMLNMQDYESAYKLLDENFKKNYFKTEQEFENYIKTKVFLYNKVNYKEYGNQISSLHTYKVEITDATGESQNVIEFDIVIKLLEGTNFVMSFAR